MNKHKTKQNGITLISLVISIIVMLILAGVTLSATVGEDGIITRAQISSLMSRYSLYKEELEINGLQDTEIYSTGEAMKSYIPSMEDIDIEKFVIMKRELLYISDNELEIEAAKSLGIGTAETGEEGSVNSINEVKAVISSVINLSSNSGDGYKIPEDDFTETTDNNDNSVGLIGTRLYDKNSINDEKWNIVIEYNNSNQEVARYGSGYYWIKAGETYIIDGKSMTFENDFIIDYPNKSYKVLSGRAVNWNLNATLAVSDGLVLNVDPMSLADGEWRQNAEDPNFYDFYVTDSKTGKEENKEIQKTGDVVYDATSRALKFNEDSVNNPTGEGGYLKLLKSGVDFSNGFTFEMYANFSRLNYYNINSTTLSAGGLFCRLPYLGSVRQKSMRFLFYEKGTIAGKFEENEVLSQDLGWNMTSGNGVRMSTPICDMGEDVYITFTYIVYDETQKNQNPSYDNTMIENNYDKVEVYKNGELVGYTYHDKASFERGLNVWNKDDCPFFIGCSPWNFDTNPYFTKGSVYTTRLYEKSLNSTEVKDNYDTTLKYRSSF